MHDIVETEGVAVRVRSACWIVLGALAAVQVHLEEHLKGGRQATPG